MELEVMLLYHRAGTNLNDIEYRILDQLAKYLIINDAWKKLLEVIPTCFPNKVEYHLKDYEIALITRSDLQIGGNAAYDLLRKLGTKGMSVEELAQMLDVLKLERELLLIRQPEPLMITSQLPREMRIYEGTPLILKIEADGFPYPRFQWFCSQNSTIIRLEGAEENKLIIPNCRVEDSGSYCCRVHNSLKREVLNSYWSAVNVLPTPHASIDPPWIPGEFQFIQEPVSVALELGKEPAEFLVEVDQDGPFIYQWYWNGKPIPNMAPWTGVTSPRLHVSMEGPLGVGSYYCEVVGPLGARKTSRQVTLDVHKDEYYYAEDKIALLIGMCHNRTSTALPAVMRDIILMEDRLKRLKFRVLAFHDLTKSEMYFVVDAFCSLLRKSGPNIYGVFYFAGHGFEHHGQCYLQPYDAPHGFDIEDCVPADKILQQMQMHNNALNMIILDICRESCEHIQNVNSSDIQHKIRGNTVYLYATSSGMMSYERDGAENGMFMRCLEKVICQKRMDIRTIQMRLSEVLKADVDASKYLKPEIRCNLQEARCLDDPINTKGFTSQMKGRSAMWDRCNELPDPIVLRVADGHLQIRLTFTYIMSNVMGMNIKKLDQDNQVTWDGYKVRVTPEINCSEKEGFFVFSKLQQLKAPLRPELVIWYTYDGKKREHCEILDLGLPLISGFQELPKDCRQPTEQEESCSSDTSSFC